jgi:hypothetical protein
MILRKNPTDNAYLVRMEKRARCCGDCGAWLEPGALAWSYLPSPVDGNYVECGPCRTGEATPAISSLEQSGGRKP